MDPDYELPETIREEANKRREKEKQEQVEKAKAKINEDFQKEFTQREDQLIEIQNRITCLAKTLHVLRYVLVSNYYNKPEALIQPPEDELSIVDSQNRLHPAVKKLINEKDLVSLDFTARKTRRTKKQLIVAPIDSTISVNMKEEPAQEIPGSSNALTSTANEVNFPRNRQMSKRTIIVGNISKWMPSDHPEDNSTHKWMVYIRGPQGQPNIDDIVEKIVFHLHPSYQPHDVIEINQSPFHLTRRGWGEFPMRCQLHFKVPLNKPVDIIHNLKLDKTYSGRQTLGSETVVELTLYKYGESSQDHTLEESSDHGNLKTEMDEMDISSTIVPSSSKLNNSRLATSLKTETTFVHDSHIMSNNSTRSMTEVNDENDSFTDIETVEVMDTSHTSEENEVIQVTEVTNESYFCCPALSDHTYSLKTVKSY